MFWTFSIATALAICLIKLGALSVWVTILQVILSSFLSIAFVAAVAIGGVFAWRRYKGHGTNGGK